MKLLAAVVQMTSTTDVDANMAEAERLVADAAAAGARLVGLPENFAYLGPEAQRLDMAEVVSDDAGGPVLSALRRMASEHSVHLVAGGMAERSSTPGRAYNTCAVLGPDGGLVARYRKVHLFDVELPVIGGRRGMKESDSVVPGEELVTAELPWGRFGLSVCYDLRFPELYRGLAAKGCAALLVPAAFTLQTGKDHWEVLLRARAIENQAYVLAPAQFGRHSSARTSWGKAMVVDPWGVVVANVGDRVGHALAELDTDVVERVRRDVPALRHRRL